MLQSDRKPRRTSPTDAGTIAPLDRSAPSPLVMGGRATSRTRHLIAPLIAPLMAVVLATVVLAVSTITVSEPASAGPAAGDAKEWTQRLNNTELGKIVGLEGEILDKETNSLEAQLEQLTTELKAYEIMVRNITSLPEALRREAMKAVSRLRNIAQQAGSIAHSGLKLDQFLRSDLITDPLFERAGLDRAKISERYSDWQGKWQSALRTNLENLGLTMKDVSDEARFVDQLSKKFGKEKGQLQALQGANKMASSVARQLNSLRMITSSQAEQNAVAWGRVMQDLDRKEAAQRLHERQVHETLESLQGQKGHRTMQEIFGFGGS